MGELYTYNVTTEDLNGDAVTISEHTGPGWLSLTDHGNGTATLFGTPSVADLGGHAVVESLKEPETVQIGARRALPLLPVSGEPRLSDQPRSDMKRRMTASKPLEIVVFMARRAPRCDFCGEDLGRGAWIRKVEDKAQCLECADLDHLVFLPRGDAALTRRAGKHSRLKAVVEALLADDADVNAVTGAGASALAIAQQTGRHEVATPLEQAGATR